MAPLTGSTVSAVRPWILLAVLVAAASAAFELLGLPTPLLFGGLVGALVYALARPGRPLALPKASFTAGQAVVGVIIGATIDWSSLGDLGTDWLIVLLVSCFSLVVSVLVGQLLMRHDVSRATATFSSIAGGAAGLTALAQDLGADARVVAVLQYLRLLVVLVTLPVIVAIGFGAGGDGASTITNRDSARDVAIDVALSASAIAIGLIAGKLLRLPAYAILGPLVAASLLTLIPVFEDAGVPFVVAAVGYLAIGVQVGLKFTVASVRAIGAMVPTALLTIGITLAACGGLGWLLTATTDASGLDAYLATTPGGIYAVMGTAAEASDDPGFVAASQVLRLLIVLGSAPFVATYLRRFDDRPPA